jgi:hypothetical protein
MVRRAVTLVATVSLTAVSDARAQTAGAALRAVLSQSSESTGAFSQNASDTLYSLLLGETTTFPIGSAAGGFSWTFDTGLNAPRRRSQSFGPMFAERPFTTGLHKLNVGMAFQYTKFSSVAGQPLSDLQQTLNYNFGQSFYNYSSSLAITLERTIFSATYGVGGRVDLGVIVPVGHSAVAGTSAYSQRDAAGPFSSVQNSSGSSSGVGDVIVRAKAAVLSARRVDAAVDVDLRLPTGDTDKLLGTGQTQAKVLFIAASTIGVVTPHANVGYTFGGSGLTFGGDNRFLGSFGDPELVRRETSQEFDYTTGFDIAASSSITVAGDVIGRAVRNSAALNLYDSGQGADRYTFFQIQPGTVNLLLAAIGTKVKVGGTWLVTATMLFPLNNNGVKPRLTPVVGVERAF